MRRIGFLTIAKINKRILSSLCFIANSADRAWLAIDSFEVGDLKGSIENNAVSLIVDFLDFIQKFLFLDFKVNKLSSQ